MAHGIKKQFHEWDLTTRNGRSNARRAGFDVPLRTRVVKPFWSSVDKSGDCWIWTGPIGRGGYGKYWAGDGQHQSVHRYSWAIANGPIPEGMVVCHHCDNKKCVRPVHLFAGTQKDNMHDMMAKGRARFRGVAYPVKANAKA